MTRMGFWLRLQRDWQLLLKLLPELWDKLTQLQQNSRIWRIRIILFWEKILTQVGDCQCVQRKDKEFQFSYLRMSSRFYVDKHFIHIANA
mmetsp:Transcript_26908/g.40725  ORF Transcript_26908/g.40725 Transcript_26908/m.40725 type:complete len:90 (+) Transcript_26908:587-856(+)